MDNSYLSFDTWIDDDTLYTHRGDIFSCDDLFKSIDEIDKDDHILGKPSRPVIIISNDNYNRNIVKVLPFSTKAGSDDANAISSGRVIRVPGINNNPNPSYIDVSQVFTINTYQLKIKLGHASQEIVDAAVAMHTLQNVADSTSINTLVKIFKDRYPKAQVFNQITPTQKNTTVNKQPSIVNNMYNPFEELYSTVTRVPYEELISEIKHTLKYPETKEDAYELYQEWLSIGTDLFRSKYGISRQQYIALRDKCVVKMLGKVPNFKKHDWST